MQRLTAAFLLAAVIAAGYGGAARAMGSMPESQLLCYESLHLLQTNPGVAPSVAELEEMRGPIAVRMEVLEFLLLGIEDELDLADTELDKTDLEQQYVDELLTGMKMLSVQIDELERELDCWDEALRRARVWELLNRKPGPPNVWMPPQPKPRIPGDPANVPIDDFDDILEEILANFRYRMGEMRMRLVPLIEEAEDYEPADRVHPTNDGFSIFIGGGGSLPLGEPDLGDTQEIDTTVGGFAEIGIDYRVSLTPQFDTAVGVRATWQREGLDRLDNKGMAGSLPLDGGLSAWTGMVDLRLIYSPAPDWDLYAGGGVGGAYRHLDLETGGMSMIDDGGIVFAWKAETGVGYRFCGDCGLTGELFLRYQGLGGLEVESPGMDLDLGPQHDLFFGLGLRYGF